MSCRFCTASTALASADHFSSRHVADPLFPGAADTAWSVVRLLYRHVYGAEPGTHRGFVGERLATDDGRRNLGRVRGCAFPFPLLAGLQAAVYALGILLVLVHIHRVAPEIFPQVGLWDRSAVRAIIGPSSYFGLISMSTFLSFEVPVLILQREAGAFVVVAFTAMRTIFSMSRLILIGPTQAMGAEITRLYGRQEWRELTAIYNYSERLIFSLIPVVNLGMLIISPVLLAVWLHKPQLFSVLPYVVTSAISMILSAKEHKFQFQFSTNTHERLARLMFFSYIALVAIAIPMVHWYGMLGFLYSWLGIELFQVIRIIGLNRDLFAHTGEHRMKYVYRLAFICLIGLAGADIVLTHTHLMPYHLQFAAGFAVSATMALISFFLFNMQEIVKKLYVLFRNKLLAGNA